MQQVNLLIKQAKAPVAPLQMPHLLLAVAALSLLLLLVSVTQFWHGQRQAQRLDQLQAELNQVLATTATLASAPADARVTALAAEIADMRDRLNAQRRLLHNARVSAGQETQGYAPQMRELAQAHRPGLWLTRIQLSHSALGDARQRDAAVQLEGLTQRPDLVPAFLQRLAAAPGFAGQRFAGFELLALEAQQSGELHQFRIWGPVKAPSPPPPGLLNPVAGSAVGEAP